MKSLAQVLTLSSVLFAAQALASSSEGGPAEGAPWVDAASPAGSSTPESDFRSTEPLAQPPSPQPKEVPVVPPGKPPPPPDPTADSQGPQPAQPAGQWVYTEQYGWVWMPYGDAYTHAPADGNGNPYMYVYTPTEGWTRIVAPWVWGWGPVPYFGVYGGWHFGWYGHGWGRGWQGFRPAPYRRGFVFRGGGGRHR